jgi:predicted GIY-YIG superfamily endonuclease
MKCYIYKIENKITGEKYIGQTLNYEKRIENHLSKLRNNKHVNYKLQNAWNKYGEENFVFSKEEYDISKEELNEKEILEISKNNSFKRGYNLTLGGDGGNTRGNLSFEEFCLIYLGNIKYKGLTNRTANFLGIDSSTVSSIARGNSYKWFQEKVNSLSDIEKRKILEEFEIKLKLKENPNKELPNKLSNKEIVDFLCVISTYGRGAEAAATRYFGRTKGFKHNILKGEYKEAFKEYLQLTENEIEEIAVNFFNNKNLQQFCTQKIHKLDKINRLIAHYKIL